MNIIWSKIISILQSIVALIVIAPQQPTPAISIASPTPTALVEQSVEPVVSVAVIPTTTPPPVIDAGAVGIGTPSPTPSATPTPNLQEQIEELKRIIASYTPEPTPPPQIIYIIAPTPTPIPPTPIPTPEPDHLPSFQSIMFYTAQGGGWTKSTDVLESGVSYGSASIPEFINQSYARCEYPCIKVKTPHETKVKVIYVIGNVQESVHIPRITDIIQSSPIIINNNDYYRTYPNSDQEFKTIHLFNFNEAGLLSGVEYDFYLEATNHDGITKKVKLNLDGMIWKMP